MAGAREPESHARWQRGASPELCVQGQFAQTCVGGATPFDELPDMSGCSLTATDAVGNSTYCCEAGGGEAGGDEAQDVDTGDGG
jgi:hypothetical protein